ncbi:MAG: RrF2 family transcriptional regulator [Candidatus Latescibacterota bacterium]
MKLSTRGRYGTRAVLELALRYGTGPVLVREIAESQEISERYLENILNALRKSGIVTSARGVGGGYQLSRDPSRITVGEIVRSLEGPLDVVECTGGMVCSRVGKCVTFHVWNRLKTLIENELDSVTLQNLVEQDRQLNKSEIIEYQI